MRFQDDLQKAPSSPRPTAVAAAAAPAPAPTNLDVRLGLLLVGGIYATDLLLLEAPAVGTTEPHPQPQPQPLPLQVRGLAVSNLSVGLEPRAAVPPDAAPSTSQQQHAVVLRLWADREGPFDALFTLALPPDQQEVGQSCLMDAGQPFSDAPARAILPQ